MKMSVPRSWQHGFTLVELMVAMVIGLVLLAAMYSGYLASSRTTGVGRALSQIAEDASAAMGVLRSQVNAAAYSAPVGGAAGPGTGFTHHASTGDWVRGCDTDFADMTQPIGLLTCGASGSNALAVAYEAHEFNSITKLVAGARVPMDCLGNALPLTSGYYLSYSRFYIKDNALYCMGPGNAGGQALVDNISGMRITYGVAAPGSHVAASYKSASEVDAAGTWPRVVAVRVCLVVRSADPVLDSPTPYQDCDPFEESKVPGAGDRRMYRTFTSTFVIQNRRGTAL
ncbi:PilW family protein [Ideonella oryzae]|uniref:PilW family protein n=1 Tax=Ideonella oryzae TaxID=2937441 RepID=A0ABT1BJA7_9BURK|nr:PilW family protein [Ideonella oryzae]MCO5975944.1 PilW family protein [Ideonella oryzae]